MDPGAVVRMLHVLHDYFEPDALDSAYSDAARFLHPKRTTQPMGEYLVKFDLLWLKAEDRMQPGGSFLPRLSWGSGKKDPPWIPPHASRGCWSLFVGC